MNAVAKPKSAEAQAEKVQRRFGMPNAGSEAPSTAFLLMAQYGGRALISVDELCRDWFPHLTRERFMRKHAAGEIVLPLVRIEESYKSLPCVHLADLAAYIDKRRAAGVREFMSLHD